MQHGPIFFVLKTLNCSIFSQCLGQDHAVSGNHFNQDEGTDLRLLSAEGQEQVSSVNQETGRGGWAHWDGREHGREDL